RAVLLREFHRRACRLVRAPYSAENGRRVGARVQPRQHLPALARVGVQLLVARVTLRESIAAYLLLLGLILATERRHFSQSRRRDPRPGIALHPPDRAGLPPRPIAQLGPPARVRHRRAAALLHRPAAA